MVLPVVKRTRAVLRSPELGFLGRVMPTLMHTPLRCGSWPSARAGDVAWRALRCLRQPWELLVHSWKRSKRAGVGGGEGVREERILVGLG